MQRKYIMDSVEKLDEIIETINSVSAIENCNEWDWQSRYPNFEEEVNALLKQLAVQRELLLISIIWQKRNLLKQSITNQKPN